MGSNNSKTNSVPEGILNRDTPDVQKYLNSIKRFSGEQILYEFHIFFLPLNPSDEILEVYKRLCESLTEELKKKYPDNIGDRIVKNCVLALPIKSFSDKSSKRITEDYINAKSETVRVMQTSCYMTCASLEKAIEIMKFQAEFMQRGFNEAFNNKEISQVNVCREKIEIGSNAKGVPEDDNEENNYFEYHIRVVPKKLEDNSKDNTPEPMTEEELQELENMSNELTKHFNVPVPLSYTNNNLYSRYLNIRCENVGNKKADEIANSVAAKIKENERFKVDRTIREYIVYDTYRKLDAGWIDFGFTLVE